jgi:hypothetical protein
MDGILLLNGVPKGRRFRGGSRRGCKFFHAAFCIPGDLSASEPDPMVKPRLCLMLLCVFCSPGRGCCEAVASTICVSLTVL